MTLKVPYLYARTNRSTMKFLSLLIPVLFSLSCTAQTPTDAQATTGIMFYNLENLFDTIDDPNTDDRIFLPDADRQWNTEKYETKLRQMARVIAEGSDGLPMIVGLCEVENAAVLNDLIAEPALQNGNYKYVHFDSPDERGIDVALLYNEKLFNLKEASAIPVHLIQNDTVDHTRDILAVAGTVRGSNTVLLFFVNHWPSRSEGEEASAWKRVAAAQTLKLAVDSVRQAVKDAHIVIMGDFNDTPFDKSIQSILGAVPEGNSYAADALVNLMANDQQNGKGSYNYKGKWQALDQMIVSANLVDGKKTEADAQAAAWIQRDWMMFTHPSYGLSPNRTYSGTKWSGGFSDHLPVYVPLKIK